MCSLSGKRRIRNDNILHGVRPLICGDDVCIIIYAWRAFPESRQILRRAKEVQGLDKATQVQADQAHQMVEERKRRKPR